MNKTAQWIDANYGTYQRHCRSAVTSSPVKPDDYEDASQDVALQLIEKDLLGYPTFNSTHLTMICFYKIISRLREQGTDAVSRHFTGALTEQGARGQGTPPLTPPARRPARTPEQDFLTVEATDTWAMAIEERWGANPKSMSTRIFILYQMIEGDRVTDIAGKIGVSTARASIVCSEMHKWAKEMRDMETGLPRVSIVRG